MFASGKSLVVPSGDYQISRSLRFNSADSAYLSRTLTTPTNNTVWSFSFWLKRSKLATQQYLLNVSSYCGIGTSNDIIYFWNNVGVNVASSTAVFRDASAWYHFVFVSNGTTIKGYVNNSEVMSYTGTITNLNSAIVHNIGRDQTSNDLYLDGYMTEVNFIDGQALTPSSFGETNAQTGVWQPKAYSGSYGTNGFYLNFSDNSNTTAATLGKDYSGNGNNWTPNNFSVTAGAGNDSLVDSPTSYGVDTGVGGTVRGNYCTANPLDMNSSLTIRNGNLDVTESGSTWLNGRCTFGMSSDKWYFESTVTSGSFQVVGIANSLTINTGYNGGVGNWAYSNDGAKIVNGVYTTPYGASFTINDVIGVAFDADAGTLTMYKNGTSQGTLVSGLAANTYFPWVAVNGSTVSMNFGQRPFAYTAPSGYKALNTQNLPTPTIGATTATLANTFFAPALYTGNDGTQTVTTGIDMATSGGLVWFKNRSAAIGHALINPVVGYGSFLQSNSTAAENAFSFITATSSTGFTMNTGSSTLNGGAAAGGPFAYVAWNWKANGAGSSNTAGSITSTVSASTTSGFSVVTYTGVAADSTVGHGLGVAPSMIIAKSRTNAGTNWVVYHTSLGINQVMIFTTSGAISVSGYWGTSNPTSTVFGVKNAYDNNSGNMVAYCFAPIAGFSAFGSYTGNGSADGPFVHTGFRPACIIFKVTDGTASWLIHDNKRNTNNVVDKKLFPNLSDAEATADVVDFLSNGFKLRGTNTQFNGNGYNYIFAAFAENPFKYSLAR